MASPLGIFGRILYERGSCKMTYPIITGYWNAVVVLNFHQGLDETNTVLLWALIPHFCFHF